MSPSRGARRSSSTRSRRRPAGTTAGQSTSANDGKLYVAVGEGHHEDNAQSLATLSGKLLRINADGTIPLDNPFYGSTTGNNRAIWSLGLRNPFTFDIQSTTGRIFINDVGENAFEEINEAWVGPNSGFNAGLQLRLARHRGAAQRPALPQPVPRLSAGRRRLRDHGRCVLQPRDRQLPARVRRRLLLRRLLRGVDQERRPDDSAGLDVPDGRRYPRPGRRQGRRRRGHVLPGPQHQHVAPRAVSGRRPGAGDRHASAEPNRAGRPERDVHRQRERLGSADLPVAAERDEHRRRDGGQLHGHERATR